MFWISPELWDDIPLHTHQVGAHVGLQANLLAQRELLVQQGLSLLDFADHLLVSASLEPVWKKRLHDLVQDLAGDQQRGQTLEDMDAQ